MTQATTSLATLPDPTMVEESSGLNLRFSRRSWIVIAVSSIVCGLAAMLYTFTLAPQYQVTREFLVVSTSNVSDNDTLVTTLQYLMIDRGFAAELRQQSGVDLPVEQITNMVVVDRPAGSALLTVSVTASDLETAKKLNESVLPTLRNVIERNQRNTPIELRIPGPLLQEIYGIPKQEVVYTSWYSGLLGGLVVGFLVSFVVVALRNRRQPVVGTARDVSDALDLPVLAVVPAIGEGRRANPQDAVLGMLAAIERLGAKGPIHRLVVVGPESSLERSKLILALGCAIARNFDQPVALVDADLEHGYLTKLVGATDEPGLSECLTGELRADQTLLRMENGHAPPMFEGMVPPAGMMRVMPAGLNRGGSLLRMRSSLHQVLGALSGRYVVLIDGPAVPGPVPSTQLLSLADATIVVVTEGSTAVRDTRFTGDAIRVHVTGPAGAVVLKR